MGQTASVQAAARTEAILTAIRTGVAAKDLAALYADAVRADSRGVEQLDWGRIHTAIGRAWGKDGLTAVRTRARLIACGLIVPSPRGAR